jgi:hypothetical protein
MSTRSMIAHQTPNGIEAIYCHNSGYPEHHLPILTTHYTADEAVAALMAVGDLSELGADVGRKHGFNDHGKTPETRYWCLAYGRDRAEEDAAAKTYASEDEFLAGARENWADYIYMFRDGRWLYRDARKGAAWRKAHS